MASDSLAVGKIIYLIDKRSCSVRPCLIVEEIIKKTIDGEQKIFYGKFSDDRVDTIDMNSDCLFLSIADVKKRLLQNAKASIDAIIDNATNEAAKMTGQRQEQTEQQNEMQQ